MVLRGEMLQAKEKIFCAEGGALPQESEGLTFEAKLYGKEES